MLPVVNVVCGKYKPVIEDERIGVKEREGET